MRLIIVARDAVAAEAVRRALRHAPNCEVAGYASSTRPCDGAVRMARPDAVVVDDGGNLDLALTRLSEVRAEAPAAKIVLLSSRMAPDTLREASAAGANAAVDRSGSPITIGTLIREIVAGTVFHAFANDGGRPEREPVGGLTSREGQILRLVAAGASNHSVAKRLWVTEQTVKFHLSNVYRKLGVANRTEAAHYAHVHGVVTDEADEPGGVAAA